MVKYIINQNQQGFTRFYIGPFYHHTETNFIVFLGLYDKLNKKKIWKCIGQLYGGFKYNLQVSLPALESQEQAHTV